MTDILVVDDDPSIRGLLEITLEELGVVHAAASAEQADQILDATDIDVAIVDVMMPGRSGLDLLAEWRASSDPRRASLPVCILSARDSQEDVHAGYRTGADMYLTKPFDPDLLLTTLPLLLDPSQRDSDVLAELRELARR
jgi:DNA-binding response OmpR family regulator